MVSLLRDEATTSVRRSYTTRVMLGGKRGLIITVSILFLSFFSSNVNFVTSQTVYTCPGVADNPVVIPAPSSVASTTSFNRQINQSSIKSVCIFIRITPRSDAVDMESITRTSKNNDFDIVPVARSYNGGDWERVAGPFAQELSITNCCTIDVPTNVYSSDDNDNGRFLLMSFNHELSSDKEVVSRFLQQTTFGPTMDLINSWNYSNSMDNEMFNWVKNQMDPSITAPTYHRSYFRQRTDFSLFRESILLRLPNQILFYNARPRHPCSRYSRWRRFSFTLDDFIGDSVLTVSNWFIGRKLLSVNGVARTVVSSPFQDEDGNSIPNGSYYLCRVEEIVDGLLSIQSNLESECISTYNPVVDLPTGAITSDIRQLSLPSMSSLGTIEKTLIQTTEEFYFGEAFYLQNDISTSGCSSISPNGVYANILGTLASGEQVWYAAHVETDENTLDNPVTDAGAAMTNIAELLGANDVDENYSVSACPVPSRSFVNENSCYVSTNTKACSSTYAKKNDGDAVVVCGSPGEDANDPLTRNTFSHHESNGINSDWESQKKNIWSMVALESEDQLRQRMAWALSQILVVAPNQIEEDGYSEIYLNYYDIFVRNAFGSYFDVLKEVSYSPLMAEMLSFLDSKSSAFVLEDSGAKAYPDENYAREIMQLFSIGIYELNMDGTQKLDKLGSPILTYDNTMIQNFARGWTGFIRHGRRSNIEVQGNDRENRMDPMKIRGVYRDPFPKMNLYDGFIGDKVPLCEDLPSQHFLKEGATFRILGSSLTPELHEYRASWDENEMPTNVLVLSSSSNLRSLLSTRDVTVTLAADIDCVGGECEVDTLRLIQVSVNPAVYYEYLRRPCVELSFYDNGKKVSTKSSGENLRNSMCANPNVEGAYDGCCSNPSSTRPKAYLQCLYDLEKTTFSTAQSRCQSVHAGGDICDWYTAVNATGCTTLAYKMDDNWIWTNQHCPVKAKVDEDGNVAIVHEPILITDHPRVSYVIDQRVHPDNTNNFKVQWNTDDYPNSSNSCASDACFSVYRGCYCDIDILETSVFNSLPSSSEIISQLHVGAFNPEKLPLYIKISNTGEIGVWHKNGNYDKETIFSVTYRGKETFLKNVLSTVSISGATQYSFRNPPSFINVAYREPRDAMYESEAILENYFYHDNVAPFLALRLIQRFGISNPSPQYIERVATAFKDGNYMNADAGIGIFGDNTYGNLEATVAAIIFHSEARTIVLDADLTSGSLNEPMVKVMRFMRAMLFQRRDEAGDRIKLVELQAKIGQEPHSSPNVFSFFKPEYAAPGHIKAASLASPEAQIMSGPNVIGLLNGLISLVNLGLTECYSGFGERTVSRCGQLQSTLDTSNMKYTRGELIYSPTATSNSAESVVDELSLLLTAGRLSSVSRNLIINAYNNAPTTSSGLQIAQNLFATTPEFHSTNVVDTHSSNRPELEVPEPSNKRYKAIVFVMLEGGLDSFNVLVPHSGCSGGDTSYLHYNITRGAISIPQNELHQIDASTSSQVCSTFGIHPKLPHLKSLYDTEDLLWISNMGVLQEKVTKANWRDKTRETALFAHNIQQEEVYKMDIFDQEAGRGVGGRITDVLLKRSINAGTVSTYGLANALVSTLASLFVLDPRVGFERLNPMPWAESIIDEIKNLNNATNLGSGLFAETWGNLLYQAIGENDILYNSLKDVSLPTEFPVDNNFGRQLNVVAKSVKTKSSRGTDRDIFYVESGGFDTHDNIKQRLDEKATEINDGLAAFTTEMKAQNAWDDVTVVVLSEFARTMTGNTGAGSDHAWGGNYFIAGGEVNGKRILGTFPDTFSNDGSTFFEPGIAVPSLPFDALWNGVAQWYGLTTVEELDEVLPNRNKFSDDLFNVDDLYTTMTTPSPIASPITASSSPSIYEPKSDCVDSPFRFKIIKDDGSKISRDCGWVANKSTNFRCGFVGVREQCPSTCNSCTPCVDATARFKFPWKGNKITRDCGWVATRNTANRCSVEGMEDSCRVTCNNC